MELLDLSSGELTKVAEGLPHPQGLVMLDGRLYVSHVGNSCENWAALADELEREDPDLNVETLRQCYPRNFERIHSLLPRVLAAADGHVSSFLVGPDGGLTDHALELDGVPVGTGAHGHNALATDGVFIYGSVGYPGDGSHGSAYHGAAPIEAVMEPGRGRDMAGAVYRFRPSDPEGTFEIFARGLRNTYGISIASDGTVWGADNDGGSDQLEELNAIRYGHDYGFPEYGTGKAPQKAGITEPFRLIPGMGSSAVLASDDDVYYAHAAKWWIGLGGRRAVVDFTSYDGQAHRRVFYDGNMWVTALLERGGLLYVVRYDGSITVIDPERRALTIREVAVDTVDSELAFDPRDLEFEVGEVAAIDFNVGKMEHAFYMDGVGDAFKGMEEGLSLTRGGRWPRRFEHVFEEPCIYKFVCLIHEDQGMSGTIVVSE